MASGLGKLNFLLVMTGVAQIIDKQYQGYYKEATDLNDSLAQRIGQLFQAKGYHPAVVPGCGAGAGALDGGVQILGAIAGGVSGVFSSILAYGLGAEEPAQQPVRRPMIEAKAPSEAVASLCAQIEKHQRRVDRTRVELDERAVEPKEQNRDRCTHQRFAAPSPEQAKRSGQRGEEP